MQKTIALFAIILIGATASFSFAAQPKVSKASQTQSASKPAQAMPHDGKAMSHDMSGMSH